MRLPAFCLALVAASTAATAIHAAAVELTFTGVVQSLTNYTAGTPGNTSVEVQNYVSVGDMLSGYMLIEDRDWPGEYTSTDGIDGVGTTTQHILDLSLLDITIESGSTTYSYGTDGGDLFMQNDVRNGSAADDRDALRALGYYAYGSMLGSANIAALQFAIGDDTTGLLTDSLFPSALDVATLAAGNTIDGNWNYLAFDNGDQIRYSLSSISVADVSPVPLPAGLSLLLGGVGALGLFRRKRRVELAA